MLLVGACTASGPERARPLVLVAVDEPAIHVVLGADEDPARVDTAAASARTEPSAAQRAAYEARAPKSIIDAQLYRVTTTERVVLGDGAEATATLVDLAPAIGVWFVLTLARDGGETESFHLENPSGTHQRVQLAARGITLLRGDRAIPCDLWTGELAAAQVSGQVYGPLCDGALALRNVNEGHKTNLEWTTDLLRDNVWGGDAITNAVKVNVFYDSEVATADVGGAAPTPDQSLAPVGARVAPEARGRLLNTLDLGLPPDEAPSEDELVVGAWYAMHAVPDVWVSIMQPRYVDPVVFVANAARTNALDAIENVAPVYTVAFDLAAFDLGYEIGTDHPRLGWSNRETDAQHDATLPGPDGFDEAAPLVRAGLVDPAFLTRVTAVFAGGFKREHGAFRWGDLAAVNQGSHYGFVEFGTVLSRLQPGLATIVVDEDGTIDLKTWTAEDDDGLWHVRHARQNGVALIEPDEAGNIGPGALVDNWHDGNWAGSVDGSLRSQRAGICLQEGPAGRFLLYSYFSAATPSAMTQVFTAYGCRYAMSLDMNALEHTYLAVDVVEDGEVTIAHLVQGMSVLDITKRGAVWPRFIGYADNRDSFYVLRKPTSRDATARALQ